MSRTIAFLGFVVNIYAIAKKYIIETHLNYIIMIKLREASPHIRPLFPSRRGSLIRWGLL
jgi:hypothetical protein